MRVSTKLLLHAGFLQLEPMISTRKPMRAAESKVGGRPSLKHVSWSLITIEFLWSHVRVTSDLNSSTC